MTAPVWVRPANWDSPGVPPSGTDARRILDAVDFFSSGVPVGAVYKPADTFIDNGTGGTTYTNDSSLSFEVEALEVVRVKLEVIYDAGTVEDFKQRFLLPSGSFSSAAYATTSGPVALVDGDGEVTGLNGAGVGGGLSFMFWGTLFVGATGGTVNWQWAQNTSGANDTTVRKGGYLEYARMGFSA